MKTIVTTIAIALLSLSSHAASQKPAKGQQPKPRATCVGATPCNACSTCNYCGHCAKRGGTCGVKR